MRDTFVVQILDSQNATWQGTVTWTEGRQSKPFRSALELLKLIDSSLEEKKIREASEQKGVAGGR